MICLPAERDAAATNTGVMQGALAQLRVAVNYAAVLSCWRANLPHQSITEYP